MCGIFMRENREIPSLPSHPRGCGPLGEGQGRTPEMHGDGKSDSPVVPAKPPNKTSVAEVVEERGLGKGNTTSKTCPGHRAGSGTTSALDRVGQGGHCPSWRST
jgi:hypothetical protein